MSQETLLFTDSIEDATVEIQLADGRVLQQFTESVFVAELPDELDPNSLDHVTATPPADLDSVSRLSADAWQGLLDKRRRDDLERSPSEGMSWDTEGFSQPRAVTAPDEEGIQESTGTSTSLYMVESVAVGVIIVSGTEDLAFSNAERQKVIQEVQEGLSFLTRTEPRAELSFVYDIRHISVDVIGGATDTYESAEAPWRNDALRQLGFESSRAGSIDYVANLRHRRRTRWAFAAYFTKYPLHHFAYAVSEKVVMHYFNDNWGPDLINRVFAHETCHIFGAADEYGNCQCGGRHGHLGFPNNNCVNCSDDQVSCLMNANTLQMCRWTRGQIGWSERLFPDCSRLRARLSNAETTIDELQHELRHASPSMKPDLVKMIIETAQEISEIKGALSRLGCDWR